MQLQPVVEMDNEDFEISFPVKNDGLFENNFELTAQETTFPEKGYRVLDDQAHALTIYPKVLTLSPGETGIFHIANKTKSRSERYFRLNITQTNSLHKSTMDNHKKTNGNIYFPLQISSNLIVRPSMPIFNYEIKERRFHNLSNGYVLLMQDGLYGAEKTKVVPPGRWVDIPHGNKGSGLYVGFIDKIKIISNS